MVDLELALELAHAEVRRTRDRMREVEDERQQAENVAAAADAEAAMWEKRADALASEIDAGGSSIDDDQQIYGAIAESVALLTEALPDIRRRSASRAARIDVHLERLRRLLP